MEGDTMKRGWVAVLASVAMLAGALAISGCAAGGGKSAGSAAEKVYVKPGEHDAYYAFLSGGHHGNVYVYGIPSCRHITTIPVFTPEPAVGYGNDEASKAMLGGRTWGDAHHPGLSETNGDYDGRWLFINDMPNARIARVDLKDFKTRQIYGPIPNVSAAHACPFPTPNTEYVFAASRFSVPVPNRPVHIEDYAKEFNGIIAGIKVIGTERCRWASRSSHRRSTGISRTPGRVRARAGSSSPATTARKPTIRSRSRPRRTRWTSSPR
jgi:nitrous-oxide reductase